MPRISGFQDIELKNFNGLDLRGPSELMPDRSLQTFINFQIGDLGQIETRPGFQLRHPGGAGSPIGFAPIKFIGLYSNDSTNQIIVQTILDNYTGSKHGFGKLYKSEDGGVTFTQISTPAASNWSCGRGPQYGNVPAGNMDIPSTSGNLTWNGTTFGGPIAGTKASSYNAWYMNDRFWSIQNSTGNVFWSAPGNAADYGAKSGNFDFTTDNKDSIVGMVPYRDRIVVFFTNSIRILTVAGPTTSWTNKYFTYYMGVRNQESIYVHNDLIYFLSDEGFYRTDLSDIEELSKPIAPVFQRRREAFQNPHATFRKYMDCIGYWKNKFFISMRVSVGASTGSATPPPVHRMFSYDTRNGAWAEIIPSISNSEGVPWSPAHSFLPVFVGRKEVFTTPYNKEGLYMAASDSSGRVWCYDDEDPIFYDGNPSNINRYQSVLVTRDIDGELPSEWKRSHRVTIRVKSDTPSAANIHTTLTVNGVAGTEKPLPVTTDSDAVRIKGPGFFRKFNLRIHNIATTSQRLEIEGITVNAKQKNELSDVAT